MITRIVDICLLIYDKVVLRDYKYIYNREK
jgi:hypothetical protein